MAETAYAKIAKSLKNNANFAVTWIVFTALVAVAFGMWWEDYVTSLRGYLAYPTAKATNITPLVATLPQLVQMATIYVVIGMSSFSKKERTWHKLDILTVLMAVWFAAFFIDGYWDYLYKSTGFIKEGQSIYWPAVIESWGLYGFGSEVLGTFSLGMWIGLTREGAFMAVIELLIELAEMIGHAFSVIIHAIMSVGKAFMKPFQATDDNDTPTAHVMTQSKQHNHTNPKRKPQDNNRSGGRGHVPPPAMPQRMPPTLSDFLDDNDI